MLKVLESTGQANLKSPEKLKYLLCPVVVQGSAEQERFYEIFDRYWEELQRPWPMPNFDTPLPNSTVPVWVRTVLVTLILGGLTWAAINLGIKENPPAPKIFFKHDPTVSIGQNIHITNLSENIDSTALRWEIVDTFTGKVELIDTQSFNLDFVPTIAGENTDREVRLFYLKPNKNQAKVPPVYASTIHLICSNPPEIDTVFGGEPINLRQAANLEVRLKDVANVQFAWDFGDSTTASGPKVSHKFGKLGEYNVRLVVNRTGLDGDCSVTRNIRISVGQDKAYFADKTMQTDKVDAMVNFSWGTWVLMGLVGLATIWYWIKWASRKPPPPTTEEPADLSIAAEKFKAADRGPYFIPFRPQDGFVRMEPQFYRLADVLRHRQEGLRKNMDIPASVNKTIADGGFPNLLSRADAVPTEYLFLIDEQSPVSHQSKLYTFLVDFLRKREVLSEVFYFKTEQIRFWNAQFPDGINPEQLVRFFPFHRLIVMGDGHGLLDPNQTSTIGAPRLRPDAVSFFRHWKHRILLTPMPVVSWTYREGALHNLFAIFPSDTEGLGETVKFAERGMDGEELPTYALWCERLLEGRQESDVNYRRWRNVAEHQDYLKNHPLLFRWVCALAVYPKPDWSITLAIGRALSPIGLELNYNNLLIISRIPWLQTGEFSPKLRKELLNELDATSEGLAREAVRTELAAIEALVQGSHSKQEHQINLAMQNFAIAPQNPENQASVREMLALDLLTPKHLAELNQNVERHFQKQQGFSQATQSTNKSPFSNTPQIPDIHAFLKENNTTPSPPEKPFFTKDFWLASGATLIYLVIFIFAWHYGGSKELTEWTRQLFSQNEDCLEEYAFVYSLKKECTADSAVLYNNAGVKAFANFQTSADSLTYTDLQKANSLIEAEINFQRALVLKKDYQLARQNLGAAYFNAGKIMYDWALSEMDDPSSVPLSKTVLWDKALPLFRTSMKFDSVKVDALHALGLIHYYAERRDSALDFYNQLLQETDSLYFDTLQNYPNLHSLLIGTDPNTTERITISVTDYESKKALSNVLVVSGGFQGMTDVAGKVFIEQPKDAAQTFLFTKKGYGAVNFRPKVKSLSYSVQMRKIPAGSTIDSDKDGVPDSKDKCPKVPGDPKNAGCPLQGTKESPIQTTPTGSESPNQQPPATIPFKEPEMVFVKGGTFRMGCDEKRDGDCQEEEKPVHDVTLSDFSIGKYEVTNEEYAVFLNEYGLTTVKDGTNKGQPMIEEHQWGIAFRAKGDISTAYYEPQKGYEKYPVVSVSWYGAVAFTEWLSKKTGQAYRLPTEAEWEYAARGGSHSNDLKFSGSNNIEEVCWYNGNSGLKTHPCGQKVKNELGVSDMSGNVWEWCNDFFDNNYYQDFAKIGTNNPKGPSSSNYRVGRGGSWDSNSDYCRTAARFGSDADYQYNFIGFRLAREEYRASGK